MKQFLVKWTWRFARWTAEVLKLVVVGLILAALLTMHWQYGYHEGREMRCWSVRLPGYKQYNDWDHGQLKIVSLFAIDAIYRIGPWIEPEWVETPDPNAPPVIEPRESE